MPIWFKANLAISAVSLHFTKTKEYRRIRHGGDHEHIEGPPDLQQTYGYQLVAVHIIDGDLEKLELPGESDSVEQIEYGRIQIEHWKL